MANDLTLEFQFRNRRFKDAEKGLRTFHRVLKKDWDGSAKVLSAELRGFLDAVAQALVERHSGAWPGGTTTNTLSRRSGGMLESIVNSVDVRGQTFTTIEGVIGGSFIAGVQEFGATIKPKSAKYLTVPLPAALNSDGTPIKKSAREWPNTFVARSKAGNLIIFQRRGAQIIPLYVLKTSVTIPPRLGMQATLSAGLPYFVDRAMDEIVRAVVAAK
ncbi:hypothetical protein [Nitratireductor sp. OM-1]|uniref:hypothetical protein n=1 Tax=Nitratireductor sp. OM-1 TaxID=1756988 RepID=UPI000DE0BE97|nr:hypothetical protein [Nitratireductor sp. OM-1]